MDSFTRRLVGVDVHGGPVNGADLCRMSTLDPTFAQLLFRLLKRCAWIRS